MADRWLRTRIIQALSGAVVAAALVGAGTALAANKAVAISGFAFAPKSTTVSVGDTITWTNSDAADHTATADDASWDAGTISAGGGTGSVTFATAGTFPYHCAIHSSMTGTVIVAAAAASARPTSRATAQPATGPTRRPTPPATDAAPTGGGRGGAADASLTWLLIAATGGVFGLTVARRRLATRR
jgi:plastocyanin